MKIRVKLNSTKTSKLNKIGVGNTQHNIRNTCIMLILCNEM